ncbi:DNA translocase FtsK [Limisalsivibrio acetivorans]|uniref:DNA translocase FtsK n=1 Tax=Limisalsivibrio acetivorans TaxID=1304888 RepID=UPI0003B41238|nr:DNA translocase FtsK [Limisalsivibrio acetivorans]
MDVERKSLTLDIIFLLSVLLVIFLGMSIYSHSPEDPSYSHIIFSDYQQEVRNLFGKTGAYTGDLAGTIFGWTALLLPLLLVSVPVKLYQIKKGIIERRLTPLAVLVAAFVLPALLSVTTGFIGGSDVFFTDKPTGGLIGLVSADFLSSLLGTAGGVLISMFLLVISIMLYFSLSLSQLFGAVKRGVPSSIPKMPELPKIPELKRGGRKDNGKEMDGIASDDGERPAYERMGINPETGIHEALEEKMMEEAVLDEAEQNNNEESEPEKGEDHEDRSASATSGAGTAQNGIDIKPLESFEKAETDYSIPLDLLDKPSVSVQGESDEQLKEKARQLEAKLADFGVDGKVREIRPGPVVTLFEYEPAPGVKINKIAGLSDDLALAMSALSVRIIAPIPGKSVVGIELPNRNRGAVSLSELLTSAKFAESPSLLTFAMGKDASGKPYISDLAKMPHLLIAGTTGSGKSVSVNTMLCSVLYKASPDLVKFVMIDPKMVELSVYEGIPHLAAPVVVDVRKAANVLKNVVEEMEGRYASLAQMKVRNIDSYNQKADRDPELERMPYLVVVVDEFADLMMVAGKEVEQSIIRIAQMARAVGIHLILATQRPSVNVITGIIKANMPARLSFKVSSKIDSRTVIDQNGAELLLGKGDSLFVPPGTSETVRVHGCFVSDDEVGRIVEHLKTLGEPEYNMDLVREETSDPGEIDESEIDDKYYEALELVQQKGFASISMIQRYLRIGYNRAARIVEIMEQKGVVAPSDGTSKPREVIKKNND